MTSSLRDLSVADLKRLGGLRAQCSAPLACAEHGAPHPCELCELDDLRAVTCTACGSSFPQGLASLQDRSCASEAEFAGSGRIAFEADAIAAFAAEQAEIERELQRKQERRRKREAKEASERLAREQRDRELELAEAERIARQERARVAEERRRESTRIAEARLAEARLAEERERVRAEEERASVEARREAIERNARDTESKAESRAQIATFSAALACLVGAVMTWRMSLVPLASNSWLYLIAYVPVTFLAWLTGIVSLFGSLPAHLTLRWWSFVPWSIVSFAWPAFIGMVFCYFLGEAFSGGAYFLGFFYFLVASILGVATMMHAGVAFSMDKPWPDAGVRPSFKGKRSWLLWIGVLLTLTLNHSVWEGNPLPFQGASEIPQAVKTAAKSNLQPLLSIPGAAAKRNDAKGSCIAKADPAACVSEQLARGAKPTTEDLQAATTYSLAQISKAVNAHNNLNQLQTQVSLPIVDSAVKSISELPKPDRGDRPAARKLLEQGLGMLNQGGRTAEAVALLKRAHQVDPFDAQIVNDLGYAHIMAKEFSEAQSSLVKALALAPKRSSAWANLAQLRIESAPNDAQATDEAARYLVVAYWFSADRSRMLKSLNEGIFCTKGTVQSQTACKLALARIG